MKRQYRLSTNANWQSMFGQAIIAITNISGSGRKLTLRSLEVFIKSQTTAANIGINIATLYQCTSCSGDNINYKATRLDSETALPSGVIVRKNGGANSYTTRIKNMTPFRTTASAGTHNVLYTKRSWGLGGMEYRSQIRGGTDIEPIIVPNNTAIVLVPSIVRNAAPIRVHAIVSVNGKTVVWEYVTNPTAGLSLFSLENTGGATVKLLSLGFQDVGTSDTPYLRLVPIGQIYGVDINPANEISSDLLPMDSSYPSISSVCKIYADVGFVPYGVPENYMTDTTSGSPKGLNYLHTKDFNGPLYRVFFPELQIMAGSVGGVSDALGHGYSHRMADLLVRKSGITINPGEGIALVASAETAAVSGNIGYSGWPSLSFAAQIDDEPQFSPYLTLNGLQTGSDVVILTPGTSTVLASADSIGGTSYSLNYDPDLYTNVDICIYKSGYIPLALRNVNLGNSGASIPVAQVADRNYI